MGDSDERNDDPIAPLPPSIPRNPGELGALPIAAPSRLTPAQRAKFRELDQRKKLDANTPCVTLADHKPTSLEDARDSTARALGELLLQNRNLRRFRRLLQSKNDKIALAAFELAIERIISVLKPGAGDAKPTQIIVNNLVGRPPKGKDSTVVEVR